MEGSLERQAQILALADEFMKAGRYSTRPKGPGASSTLANISSQLTGILTIALAIAGIGAVVARGCLIERNDR